jgi:hypothetical protein
VALKGAIIMKIEFVERIIEPGVNGEIKNTRISRYQFAAIYVTDKIVLDVGCETEYGPFILAQYKEKGVLV